jgi:tripeptide aminopeptidase
VNRASDAERARLQDLFAELCAIPSVFGHERACAQRVTQELRSLGLEVEEDDAAAESGAECGNLLARIPPRGTPAESPGSDPERAPAPRTVMLCAHLDTVGHDGVVEPVLDDGVWRSAGDTILGADNKAAVAVFLAVAHRAAAAPPPVGIELLFTVSEENALAGAKAFDVSRLRSDWGYVLDHASPLGEIVVASPTYHRITADIRGRAVHAGIRPEDGRSAIAAAARGIAAMDLGRLDEETTANVGAIEGGIPGSTNVVPEHCRLMAEARSLDADKVEARVQAMVECIEDGASAEDCDADVTVERLFEGYRTRPAAPQVQAAETALRACGVEPSRIVTGGASDANAFEASGFACVNLANATKGNHQTDESVAAADLERTLDVALALLDAVAAC